MKSLVLPCLAALLFAENAFASTSYFSRPEWEAAVPGGFVTDGFESYGVQQTSGGTIVFDAFDFVVPFNHEEIGTCWAGAELDSCYGAPQDPANMVLFGDVHFDEDGDCNRFVFHEPVLWFGFDVRWIEDVEEGASLFINIFGAPPFIGAGDHVLPALLWSGVE